LEVDDGNGDGNGDGDGEDVFALPPAAQWCCGSKRFLFRPLLLLVGDDDGKGETDECAVTAAVDGDESGGKGDGDGMIGL